jgi:hypothetical protein
VFKFKNLKGVFEPLYFRVRVRLQPVPELVGIPFHAIGDKFFNEPRNYSLAAEYCERVQCDFRQS